VLEDFRRLELVHGGRKRVVENRLAQDKGHRGEWAAWTEAIVGKRAEPIPFEEIVGSTLATLRIWEARAAGQTREVDIAAFLSMVGSEARNS
jgi:hypothetical protein